MIAMVWSVFRCGEIALHYSYYRAFDPAESHILLKLLSFGFMSKIITPSDIGQNRL